MIENPTHAPAVEMAEQARHGGNGNDRRIPRLTNYFFAALAGTTFYRMTVLDSTSSPHTNDTREFTLVENNVATDYEVLGVGTGDMGLFVDANGNVVGHTWSLSSYNPVTKASKWMNSINGRLYLQNDRELVIGRLPAQP